MYIVRLNSAHTYESISLPFHAVAIAVSNPTASPIYVRVGAPAIPSEVNADLILPAASALSQPVSARDFGVAIGDATLVTSGNTALSGLFSTTIITFLEAGEEIPAYGSYTFQSLSLSDLSHGTVAFANGTTAVYDLGPWGGAFLFISPTAGTGQGVIVVSASSDGLTYYQLGIYSYWPGIPVTLLLPRPVRYLKVVFSSSGIAGEPATGGFYSARASITEINQITYNPGGSPITQAYNIPNLGEANKILLTYGVPAISVSVANTTGNNNGEVIIETSQLAGGPWQVVTYREQIINPAGGARDSIFRTYGNLGPFTRVRLLSTGITGALVGTIYYGMVTAPDLNGMLQSIYAALGDVGNTVNVNQDIYHELASMLTSLATTSGLLSTISTTLTNTYNLDNTNLPFLSNLSAINTNIATMTGQVVAYLSYLTTINVHEASIDGVLNTNLPAIKTDLDSIKTDSNNYMSYLQLIYGVLLANEPSMVSHLNSIDTLATTYYPELTTIRTNTSTIPTINTNIATINSNISTINTNIGTMTIAINTINTNIATINTNIGTINTNIGTINTNIGTINTNIATLTSYPASASLTNVFTLAAAVLAAGFTDLGVFWTAGKYVEALQISIQTSVAGQFYITHGTAGAAAGPIYAGMMPGAGMVVIPTMTYGSSRSGGYPIPAGQTHLWFFWAGAVPAISFTLNVAYAS